MRSGPATLRGDGSSTALPCSFPLDISALCIYIVKRRTFKVFLEVQMNAGQAKPVIQQVIDILYDKIRSGEYQRWIAEHYG